jgi:hypothetical protein
VRKNGQKGPAHTTLSVREFLASKQITVLEYSPYSPDLAPSDFFLFPKIKEILNKGILMTLMTSGAIQWQLRRPFHKTSSKIVLKGGLGTGFGAQLPKGGTSKVTTVIFSNEVCRTFTAMSSRTSLSDHVLVLFHSWLLKHFNPKETFGVGTT